MSPEELKRLEDLGVDILTLPSVHDEVSLFDFVATIMKTLSTAIGTPAPTYEQIQKAADEARPNFDF